jgi:hypothetical protein
LPYSVRPIRTKVVCTPVPCASAVAPVSRMFVVSVAGPSASVVVVTT